MGRSVFISGIDTDAGKTYCTSWLAMQYQKQGLSVITMKFIQTGCIGISEDIEKHRQLMGVGELPEDVEGLTAPIILTYPASAQLAAKIDGVEIDLSLIDEARRKLEERFDIVLIEGAGGLMVPITDDFFAVDYVATRMLPIVLVTNGILGSINHTILSLEAIKSRKIPLETILYNTHFDSDPLISADTKGFIERYVKNNFPNAQFLMVPTL